MSTPQLHLHFHQESDCRKCCPSFFGLCPTSAPDPQADEFHVKSNGNVKPLYNRELSDLDRQLANIKLMKAIQRKVPCTHMDCLVSKIEELTGINMYEEHNEKRPVTYEKLLQISEAIQKIKQEFIQGEDNDHKVL